jgi:competence protein ComEA
MQRARLFVLPFLLVIGLAACGGSSKTSTVAPAAAPAAASATPAKKLNANTATEAELRTIPGVGEKIADEIMEYRPYDAATGEAKFRKELAKYIPVGDIDKIITFLEFT